MIPDTTYVLRLLSKGIHFLAGGESLAKFAGVVS